MKNPWHATDLTGMKTSSEKRKLQHASSLEGINDWRRNEIESKSKKLRRKLSQQNIATRSTATLTGNTSSTNSVKTNFSIEDSNKIITDSRRSPPSLPHFIGK
jgi:hypothetical protein